MKTSVAAVVLATLAGASAQGVTSIISAPGSAPSGCATSQQGVFGIQIVPQSGSAAMRKRQVSQIGDGQVQAKSATRAAVPVTQIGDGQIQGNTATRAAAPVTQIGDGQIQAPTARTGMVTVTVTKDLCVAAPITQIGDGQIQAPMATPVSQIRDGQIQAPTGAAVSQIRDGQIQAPTGKPVTQIGDGQIQAQTATGTPVAQIRDGQIQASTTAAAPSGMSTGTSVKGYAMLPGAPQACASSSTLQLTLNNGILLDAQNRTGYIAANSQFQFDKPAQTGAIYTAGWSVCTNGSLALGGATTFYQCLSGNFYNLYLNNVLSAGQCQPVQIEAIQLNAC